MIRKSLLYLAASYLLLKYFLKEGSLTQKIVESNTSLSVKQEDGPMFHETEQILSSGWSTRNCRTIRDRDYKTSYYYFEELREWAFKENMSLSISDNNWRIGFEKYQTAFYGVIKLTVYNFQKKKYWKDKQIFFWNQHPAFGINDDFQKLKMDYKFELGGLEVTIQDSDQEDFYSRSVSLSSKNLNFNGNFEIIKEKNQDGFFGIYPINRGPDPTWSRVEQHAANASGNFSFQESRHEIEVDPSSHSYTHSINGVLGYTSDYSVAEFYTVLPDSDKKLSVFSQQGLARTAWKQRAPFDIYTLNGTTMMLEPIVAKFNQKDLYAPIEFKTSNFDFFKKRKAKFVFTPEYVEKTSDDYLVVKNKSIEYFGHFSGWVSDNYGDRIEFKNVYGRVVTYVNWG